MSGVRVSENVPGTTVVSSPCYVEFVPFFIPPPTAAHSNGNIDESTLCLMYGGTFPRKRCREQQTPTETR